MPRPLLTWAQLPEDDVRKARESVGYRVPMPKRFCEGAVDSDRPTILFTEIKAITANWVTRNKTYYSSETLIGDPNEGTGAISFFYPYPVPLIRDHISSPDLDTASPASLPYGRIYNANFVTEPRSGGGWLRTIAAVTDPFAIEAILTGRFLTVSIGSEVNSVVCSICGKDLAAEGLCSHIKGMTYEGELCYWKMGNLRAHEISFVNVPSDVNAGITQPSIDAGEARVLLANTGADHLLDMATGASVSAEHYRENVLGITGRAFAEIRESAEEFRELYRKAGADRIDYQYLLTNTEHRLRLRNNVKGL